MLKLLKSKKGTVILHKEGTSAGLCLKGTNIGYNTGWIMENFSPMKGSFEIVIDNYNFTLVGEKLLHVWGYGNDSCMVDLKAKEMVAIRMGNFTLDPDIRERNKGKVIILKNETTDI